MPNLVFLSETPTGQLAELKATMSWPKVTDVNQRNHFLSNTLKQYYIQSLDNILNANNIIDIDDAIKGFYTSIFAFDSVLYNNLGGINTIMNTDNISNLKIKQIAKINKTAALSMFLLYANKHDQRYQIPQLSSRTRLYKFLSQGPLQRYIDVKSHQTIRDYYLARSESIHLVTAYFVYNEITKLLHNDAFNLNYDELNDTKLYFSNNRLNLTLGYAKTLYEWGIKTTIKRDKVPLIDAKLAWKLPKSIKPCPIPSALADYYSRFVPEK